MMEDNFTKSFNKPENENLTTHPPKIPKVILQRMFSTVAIGHLRFLIMDCPNQEMLPEYLKVDFGPNQELKSRCVCDVVRLCEPTYDKNYFIENQVQVYDWPFIDGGVPPPQILNDFLLLCEQKFTTLSLQKDIISERKIDKDSHPFIVSKFFNKAVHCVAGLGRAPVLVAIALIEAGFAPLDAIDFIRKCRRGAFNATQLKYLIDVYKKRVVKSHFKFLKRASTPPKDGDGFNLKNSIFKAFNFKKPSPEIKVHNPV